MFGVDVDQFRVKPPWRDLSFWAALLFSGGLLLAIVSPDASAWVHRNHDALYAAAAPLVAWLVSHGYIRAQAAAALGEATAAAAAPAWDAAEEEDVEPTDAAEPAGVTSVRDPLREDRS